MNLYQLTYNDGEGFEDIETWLFASDEDIPCNSIDVAFGIAMALGVTDDSRRDEVMRAYEEDGQEQFYLERIRTVSVVKNGRMLKREKTVIL